MSGDKAKKPKFSSHINIDPEKLTRPIAEGIPDIIVKFTATVQTSGNKKIPIDYVVSRPDNRKEKLVLPAVGEGSTENEGHAYMTYTISHDDPTGKYNVTATIRNCDEDCERTCSFEVEKDPREA